MMFPKKPTKKKKKAHKPSILQAKDGTCFICRQLGDWSKKQTQEHHIFGGANRSLSEAAGLKVYLCMRHHTEGPEAVHNNSDTMDWLRRIGQTEYEKQHTREEFVRLFGKNYL